jgi:Flp pilus assembly protein TadG
LRKLMSSVARDERGNVLFISAISVLVFMALGGSALDISRMYLVKNRLQQACDAGVLAYRRTMQGTNVVPGTTWETSKAYFDANYTPGRYGTANPIFPQPTVDANVVVHGVASVVVPMTLMQFFGMSQSTIETKCDAQLQLPNTDVMFVLDTTGSMTKTNAGDTDSRITALKNAVLSFYNTLESAKVAGTQVRYGFVPYSNTVNVGMLLKRDWVVDNATYQSRVFSGQTKTPTISTAAEVIQVSDTNWQPSVKGISSPPTYGDPENCVGPADTLTSTQTAPDVYSPPSKTPPYTKTSYRNYGGDDYTATPNSMGQCVITKVTYPRTDQTRLIKYDRNPNAGTISTGFSFKNFWTYQAVDWAVSSLKGSSANGLMPASSKATFPIDTPDNNSQTPKLREFVWDATTACIEERATLRAGVSGNAWDMDVDSEPTSDEKTRWRPYIPSIVFARGVGSYPKDGSSPTGWIWLPKLTENNYQRLSDASPLHNACPSPARKLMTKEAGLTSSVLNTYLSGLVTKGWTYHDIGFLWGLRLISREGLFASENASAPNGSSIGRNIIFMTDGGTDTRMQAYDAYGLPALDRRRTPETRLPTDPEQNAIVEDRLSKYCTIAKEQKGITVWVIAFGDEATLTPMLQNCASEGRAFKADNAAQLNDTFAEIAAKIAQLRLTK